MCVVRMRWVIGAYNADGIVIGAYGVDRRVGWVNGVDRKGDLDVRCD